MDFSRTKKKKKRKKDLDELVAEEEKEKSEDKENGKLHILEGIVLNFIIIYNVF